MKALHFLSALAVASSLVGVLAESPESSANVAEVNHYVDMNKLKDVNQTKLREVLGELLKELPQRRQRSVMHELQHAKPELKENGSADIHIAEPAEEIEAEKSHSTHNHSHATGSFHPNSLKTRITDFLFPFRASWNGVLATLYTAVPPYLFVLLLGGRVSKTVLNLLICVSAGSLLGDIFAHLLPEVYVNANGDHTRATTGILSGFMVFFIMDRFLRLCSNQGHHGHGHGHGHGHSHGHGHAHGHMKSESHSELVSSSAVEEKQTMKKRKVSMSGDSRPVSMSSHSSESSEEGRVESKKGSSNANVAVFLSIGTDFFHNFLDGMAICTSFLTDKSLGASITLTVMLHESPAEIGDLAILLQNNASKRYALGVQSFTMVGGILGALFSIWIHNMSQSGVGSWFLALEDNLLAFSIGSFLYIVALGVMPEIVHSQSAGRSKFCELLFLLTQVGFLLLGFVMLMII